MANLDPATGLSNAEAKRLRQIHGPNEPAPPEAHHRIAVLTGLVSNPLVVILLAAAGISFAIGDRVNSSIIALIVAFSIVLDSVQNFRSQAAVRRL